MEENKTLPESPISFQKKGNIPYEIIIRENHTISLNFPERSNEIDAACFVRSAQHLNYLADSLKNPNVKKLFPKEEHQAIYRARFVVQKIMNAYLEQIFKDNTKELVKSILETVKDEPQTDGIKES